MKGAGQAARACAPGDPIGAESAEIGQEDDNGEKGDEV
jgi:hypothetical protein